MKKLNIIVYDNNNIWNDIKMFISVIPEHNYISFYFIHSETWVSVTRYIIIELVEWDWEVQ